MGAQTAVLTEAHSTRQPALSRLIGISVEQFASEHWGRSAVLTPASNLTQGFTDLLDEQAVDELISERGLRTPFLRVARNGATLADHLFTAPGGVGATIGDQVSDDKLARLFADGATMVLQALHRVWPPVLEFCQRLAADLGHPVQANAYVTPPQNQGFSDHYDVHDVFVLQISGQKRWVIHEPVHPSPLRHQPWTGRRSAVERRAGETAVIDTVLSPGDCLYLPRGYLHAATALGGVSTHLTLGVHSWTRYGLADHVLQRALKVAAEDVEVRASLPLGVDVSQPSELSDDLTVVQERLIEAIRTIEVADLAAVLGSGARSNQRAAPIGPLRQLRSAEELAEHTVLRVRPYLAATVAERSDEGLAVSSRAGELDIDPSDVERFRPWWETGEAAVADLGVPLARALLLSGLAVAE
ncbi:MAG: cupin domain-containing protein [Microlunatus sp.]|nr:cupin domain-containing protein [Microlunatus sp.]